MSVPFALLFFALGTCLWVYFQAHPEELSIGMSHDEVFPIFVARRLPAGVAGLVIAGIFAASMSSLDSSMHSIATALTTDFYRRFHPEASDHRCLRLARILTAFVGFLGTGIALLLASTPIDSLFFFFQKMLGLISSGLVGIFILGIFTRRAHARGALVGAAMSVPVLYFLSQYTSLHFYLYAIVGIGTAVGVGYLASLLLSGPSAPPPGLCWWNRNARKEGADVIEPGV